MSSQETHDAEFCTYVSARSTALLRTAYLLTGDSHMAEDLLQTALSKTYVSWGRIRDKGAVDAYVRRTMINTQTSWWRRRWRGEHASAELPERPYEDSSAASAERADLWEHLSGLPARQRAVLVLRYYEDMSEAETAAVLGCSVGTVKSQASRALATLRSRLGAQVAVDLNLDLVGGTP